jgi:DNA-binding helix-hairpin-helix protein with protein kinase domain
MNLKSKKYGKLKLGNPVAKPGGEGTVYEIQNTGLQNLVAKIYNTKSIANQRHSKIAYMVRNNPTSGLSDDIAKSIIWPLDALYDSNNFFVGFLMF